MFRYHHFKKGKDDGVNFDDFKKIILLLFDGIAVQLVAQLLFTLVLSPLIALCLLACLRHTFFLFPFLFYQFFFVPQFLRNEAIGLLCFVPALNFLVVPYYLEYVFYIQSLRSGPDAVHFVPDMKQFQPVPFPFPSPSPSSSPSKVSVSLSLPSKESSELTTEVLGEDNEEKEEEEKEMHTDEDMNHGEEEDIGLLEKDAISKKDD